MDSLLAIDLAQLTYWDWFGIAILCLVLELLISGVYFFWIATAASVVGLTLLIIPSLSWKWQLMIFSVDAIGSIFVWRYFFSKQGSQPDVLLNQRHKQYTGQKYRLQTPVRSGEGYLVIDDTRWHIRVADAVARVDLEVGQWIKVVSVENQSLIVETCE